MVVLLATVVFAAPPANDQCSGAEVIPAGGAFPVLTATTANVNEATDAGDPGAPSCQTNVSHSVWYRFTPAVSGTYLFSTCADAPSNSTLDDTVIALYTAPSCSGPFTQLAGGCDDDSCTLENFQAVVGAPLVAGTPYYVVVYTFGVATPTAGNTALQLRVGQTVNDLCATATLVPLDTPTLGATSGAADDYRLALATDGGQVCSAGVGNLATAAPGRDVTFSFTPSTSGKFSWRARSAGVEDVVLHVANTCPSGASPQTVNSCVAVANRNTATTTAAEETSCVDLVSGTPYFAFVDGRTLTAGSPVELEVNACFSETEGNNTPATANALVCGLTGGIVPVGDVDFFNLGSAPGRVFAMIDGLAGATYDFDLRVTTATDMLEYDDLDQDTPFGIFAPNIAGTVITGQSYLKVAHFQATLASEPYRLYAVVQPPSSSAVAEVEPNATTAQATASGLLYFSGALGGAAPSTDVDVYRVPTTVGDLLFIALDGDPTRNNTPLNAKLELLDNSGAVVMVVNDSNGTSNGTLVLGNLAATSPSSPGEALTWRVRSAGDHFVRVTVGTGGAVATAGDYLLSVTRNCVRGVVGPTPTLASIGPTSGSIAGGTIVTLTGTNFVAGSTVSLGGLACTPTANVTGTNLECPTPARGGPGPVDVVVTNPDGQKATLSGGFTYRAAPPTVVSLTPSVGPVAGGTAVTVTGTNFFAGSVVLFGPTPATAVTVTSGTTITCQAPAGAAAGMVDVTVRNLDSQLGTLTNGYTYALPAPTVTSVNPTTGSSLGGTSVVVSGTNFQGGATVSFDGINGAVGAITPTSITVTAPAHAAGVVPVAVKNPDNQLALLPNAFTYVGPPAPTVSGIVPPNGFTSGNTMVTLTGTGFATGATVQFAGIDAQNVVVASATSITASTPPHSAGVVDVVVKNVDNQSATLTNGFTFIAVPAPTLTLVTPPTGPEGIATAVTLNGTNFQNGATVTFGGTLATAVSVVSVTQITCSTPTLNAGAVDVVVRNPDNQTAVLMNGYTFVGGGADAGTDGGAGGGGGTGGGTGGGVGGGGGGGTGGGVGGGTGGGTGGSTGGGSGGGGALDGGAQPAPKPSGCGCNQADGGTLALAAMMLAGLRRRRK